REQAHFMHVDDFGGHEVLQATYRRQTFSRHSQEGFCVGVIDEGAQRFYRTGAEHEPPLRSINLVTADAI
ncbi:AraC family ligand binding domain-containing protein, partial [Serratia bockelmannii]|uniref:AraC family ligand binding domain-containing protein n=1 Tax=Serratia bockelmannii TaxID=2703793 RepID=UPI003CED49C4